MLKRLTESWEGRLSKNALTIEDKQFIEQTYLEVTGRPLHRTSCHDCYADAVIEIKYQLKKGQMKYQLKNGVILHQHGTGKVFSNVNLTDVDAQAHLAEHPSDICFFAQFPSDWNKKSVVAKEAKPKKSVVAKDVVVEVDDASGESEL